MPIWMGLLVMCVILVGLVVLDRKGLVNLGHPAWVFFTALFFFLSMVAMVALALWALAETIIDHFSPGSWLMTAVCTLPGTLFAIYVLAKSNLRPMGRKGGSPQRSIRRILDCGLALGAPIQVILVGGYLLVAVFMQQAFDGPAYLAPLYPLVLLVLWPMMHLVFHTALVAWMLDPILILAGILIGVFWAAQLVYLLHGTVRGMYCLKKPVGKWVLYLLLAFVPVVNLILAIHLRIQLVQAEKVEEVLLA